MKSQRGMGLVSLVIWTIIIIVIIIGIILFTRKEAREEKLELYITDMLVIQGRVKVISGTDIINEDEDLLKGRKVEDCLEEKEIKKLLESGVISEEEEKFDKYYILDKATLEEIGENINELQDGYFVVNYDTNEIIYSEGIVVKGQIYYKLTDLIKLQEELEKSSEPKQNEEENQIQTEENVEEIEQTEAEEENEEE